MIYKVVMNDEEQHSIWPAGQENPHFEDRREEVSHSS